MLQRGCDRPWIPRAGAVHGGEHWEVRVGEVDEERIAQVLGGRDCCSAMAVCAAVLDTERSRNGASSTVRPKAIEADDVLAGKGAN
jgi:hypothetical protein